MHIAQRMIHQSTKDLMAIWKMYAIFHLELVHLLEAKYHQNISNGSPQYPTLT